MRSKFRLRQAITSLAAKTAVLIIKSTDGFFSLKTDKNEGNIQMIHTKDFYFASYLIANGYRMKSYSREAGITTFNFNSDEKIADLTAEYYEMRASVEPITYGNAQRNLKSIIHRADANTKDNNNESRFQKH